MRSPRRPDLHVRGPRAIALVFSLIMVLAACGGADEQADGGGAEEGGASDADVADGETTELLLQSYIGEQSAYGQTISALLEEVEAEAAVEVEDLWDGSLLGPSEILNGLQDGRLDMGHFSNAYHPGTFPLTEVVEVPFVTDNVPAQMATLNELYRENDAFREEWNSQGLHVVTFLGAPPSVSGATEPFESIDYFAGKRVRTSGANTAAVEAIGGDPVALEVGEMYEGLERGTVDMYAGMILDILPQLSLHEIAPYTVDPGMGLYATTHLNMPLEDWENLPGDVQSALEDAAESSLDMLMAEFTRLEDEACDIIFDSGGSVTQFTEEETQRWEDAAKDQLLAAWMDRVESSTDVDPEQFWEDYTTTLAAYEDEYSDYQSGVERCIESRE